LKTLLSVIILAALALSLAACSPEKTFQETKTYSLNGINNISVDGGFSVAVVTGVKHPKLTVTALNSYQSLVHYDRRGDSLSVTSNYSATDNDLRQIQLTFYVNRLNQLTINHAYRLKINSPRYTVWNHLTLANIMTPVSIRGRLQVYRLDIIGNMVVNDSGAIALTKLYQLNGQAYIHLNQVNAKTIRLISTGSSRITLSGKAHSIYADLYQRAMLIAKHLRVKNAFIKAYDYSFANIYVKDLIFAYTTKTSRVDYLGYPEAYHRALCASAILPIYDQGSVKVE